MTFLNSTRRTFTHGLAAMGLMYACAMAHAAPDAAYAIVTLDASSKSASSLLSKVEAWRKQGLVSGAQTLSATPQQDKVGFSTVAVLNFANEKAYTQWQAKARNELGGEARVRRADLVRAEGKAAPASARPVYVVSFYDSLVSAADYKTYTDLYIAPNMNSQRGSGIMADYAMYLEREPDSAKGRAVLLMGYKDTASFERREDVKRQGSAKLLENADWKRYNDIKKSIRIHTSETVAVNAVQP